MVRGMFPQPGWTLVAEAFRATSEELRQMICLIYKLVIDMRGLKKGDVHEALQR